MPGPAASAKHPHLFPRVAFGGFTLIELMVVVGIMAIVLTTGIPLVYNVMHKEPMRKTLSQLQEVCLNARAQAILKGVPTDLVFRPHDRRVDISSAAAAAPAPQPDFQAQIKAFENPEPAPLPANSGRTAIIHPEIDIEMLDVNLIEYKDQEVARVRFYPNGTCDELTLILHYRGEWKKLSLEVTTSLVDVGDVRQ